MTSLVPYASSSEEDEESSVRGDSATSTRSRKRLAAFLEDETEAKRTTKVHTSLGIAAAKPLKGDWLCYAYVPVSEDEDIYRLMQSARELLSSQTEQVEAIQEPHISITKPILVRFHEKELLTKKSQEAVAEFSSERGIARFPIAFSAFTYLLSEDTSRIFWAVEVGLGWQELHLLTRSLSDKLSTLHAREYFKDARFHSSFAWMPRDCATEEQIAKLSVLLESSFGSRLRSSPVMLASKVALATGSQTHLIHF
ncbi:hypothetical protein CBS101457_002201 [Exobasidium rhododendri]|nr:hypothetical protein CBS101457_002201 [Exobasidium rhododendri]